MNTVLSAPTPTALFRLASPVFLFVATFQRKARRGEPLKGDALHDEAQRIFRELDHTAGHEAALAPYWQLARRVLVFLVDEIMSSAEWEYRGWWDDHALESSVLHHPQKMRGILFFDDLEQAKQKFRDAAGMEQAYATDLLAILFCCLKFGFRGKYVDQPRELQREAEELEGLLPPWRQDGRAYFGQAYQHTLEIPPDYQTYMRLASVGGVVVAAVVLFIGFRTVLLGELLDGLQSDAHQVGTLFGGG